MNAMVECMDYGFREAWRRDWKKAAEHYKDSPLCPVNAVDEVGWNLLHYAAFYGTRASAMALITELHADINFRTLPPGGLMAQFVGRTAVMLALEGGNVELIDALIDAHIITQEYLEAQKRELAQIQKREQSHLSEEQRRRQNHEITYMHGRRQPYRDRKAALLISKSTFDKGL